MIPYVQFFYFIFHKYACAVSIYLNDDSQTFCISWVAPYNAAIESKFSKVVSPPGVSAHIKAAKLIMTVNQNTT